MIADLKPYPSMKESGVPWLGGVPEPWAVGRLKSSVSNLIEQTAEREDADLYVALEHVESWTGRLSPAGLDVEFDSQVKRFRSGDVLFGKLRPYLAKVTRPRSGGVCVGEFFVLRPRTSSVAPSYLEHMLRSKPIIDAINSSTFGAKMPRANWQFVGGLSVTLPPLPEQAAIVRFLDHMDRRIRRYIHAKQNLIKLLEEQKQAIIHRAVTRGLDPNVRLKPSGVEWLGDVPEHWELRRLRYAVEMRVSNVDKHKKEDEVPVRLCNYVDVYKNERITDRLSFMWATATRDEIASFRLECGDILITKDSEMWNDIGVPALVEYTALDLVCGYHLAMLRPRKGLMDSGYLLRALQSPAIAYQFHISANGVTRYGLSHDAIKSVVLPVPPFPEQSAIIRFLDEATVDLDRARNSAEREISLLREYRTRLIADVVTGKLDVREAADKLPDHPEELEAFKDAETTESDDTADEAEISAVVETGEDN